MTPSFVAVKSVRFPWASVTNVKTHASPLIVKFIRTLLSKVVGKGKLDTGVEVVSVDSDFITFLFFLHP